MQEKGGNRLMPGQEYMVDTLKLPYQAPRVSGESLQTSILAKNFKKYFLDEDSLVASYEWIRDQFQDTPEGLSTSEEEIFIDFTSSEKLKGNFVINRSEFAVEVDEELSVLKTKALRILLPFSTSYLFQTGFYAVDVLRTKYRSQLNIEK
ncbi:zinc finger BED domain-containing protein 5 [Trichonephila clavipes]|nr:zinc finger BED domain-containing protein 5 [Trichonephila clavipes]